MIRLFKFQDLDKIMDIWLQGNLEAHSFIDAEYWKKNFDSVKSVLPNAEVYVYEEDGEILGFIGMDAEYIAGIFVAAGHKGQGIGHQLIETVKKKKRLSLHVFDKNTGAKCRSLRLRMIFHASARHASASSRKKSEVMHVYTLSPSGCSL